MPRLKGGAEEAGAKEGEEPEEGVRRGGAGRKVSLNSTATAGPDAGFSRPGLPPFPKRSDFQAS